LVLGFFNKPERTSHQEASGILSQFWCPDPPYLRLSNLVLNPRPTLVGASRTTTNPSEATRSVQEYLEITEDLMVDATLGNIYCRYIYREKCIDDRLK
jgi:hypothetical protein